MLLKNMQFSFGMFCKNLKSYTEIQKQGDHDALTGLYNRNRYERDLPGIFAQHRSSLACVYIDANGLHEMNNSHGHDKGDEMLRTARREVAQLAMEAASKVTRKALDSDSDRAILDDFLAEAGERK